MDLRTSNECQDLCPLYSVSLIISARGQSTAIANIIQIVSQYFIIFFFYSDREIVYFMWHSTETSANLVALSGKSKRSTKSFKN